MSSPGRRRAFRLVGAVVLLGLGALIGYILQNVWLGLTIAIIVSLVWLISAESRRGRNRGVNDDDHGIEV